MSNRVNFIRREVLLARHVREIGRSPTGYKPATIFIAGYKPVSSRYKKLNFEGSSFIFFYKVLKLVQHTFYLKSANCLM